MPDKKERCSKACTEECDKQCSQLVSVADVERDILQERGENYLGVFKIVCIPGYMSL